MNLKEFVPPFVTDFLRKNQKITKYQSYEDALSRCSQNAYQNEELCNVIADKTVTQLELPARPPYAFNPTTVYLAFALNYFVNSTGKKTVTVLDFGGACGTHYFEARNALPSNVSLKWTVVETEQMIKAAISRGLAKGEMRFVSRIEDAAEEIDFVYSSSALQYVPAPYLFLKSLLDVQAGMILFNRMMFNRNDYDIVTVQQSTLSSNGPGKLPKGYRDRLIKYPHTTMSYKRVVSTVKEGGYECLSEFNESSGKFLLGTEPVLGRGLLFSKKNS